ncbi:MAG: hypothetical protein EZS28_029072 [Streblomastix strix]|uniref:Uncharacterized protein n=1 Tax=Streblomastix strix TaxID=222440 RepID=A0A5J4V004_9EUKA|nr:MAG: hypothetical protein EZS28_029072 [Streblomastix strix]
MSLNATTSPLASTKKPRNLYKINDQTIVKRRTHLTPELTMTRNMGNNQIDVKQPMPKWRTRGIVTHSEYQDNYKNTSSHIKQIEDHAKTCGRNGGLYKPSHPTRYGSTPKDAITSLNVNDPLEIKTGSPGKSIYMADYATLNSNPVGMDNVAILAQKMGWSHHQQAKL